MKILSIILARKNSKGLPGKNLALFNKVPLIEHTITDSINAKLVDRIIVSTDNPEIALIANDAGAETPFIRPSYLSEYYSEVENNLLFVLKWLDRNERYHPDIIVYTQITDLFRPQGIIDQCAQALIDNCELDSCFAGKTTHKNYWRSVGNNFVRLASTIPYGKPRQIREHIYREDTGIALATRPSVIWEGKRIGDKCHIIPYESSFDSDIHTQLDLDIANKISNLYDPENFTTGEKD